MTAWRRAVFL